MLIIAQDGLSLVYLDNIISINVVVNELVATDIKDGEIALADIKDDERARQIINGIALAHKDGAKAFWII